MKMELRSGKVTAKGSPSNRFSSGPSSSGSARKRQLTSKTQRSVRYSTNERPQTEPHITTICSASLLQEHSDTKLLNSSSQLLPKTGISQNEKIFVVVQKIFLFVFMIAFVVMLGVFIVRSSWTNTNLVQSYEKGLRTLQGNFPSQRPRLWKMLKTRGLAHLNNASPTRPLVFLFAASPGALEVADCLATKIAELLYPHNKNSLLKINGAAHRNSQGGHTKKSIDKLLSNTFESGDKVVLIQELELLPALSPLLFHNYCDDQNAPYKDIAILFTVYLPKYPNSSQSEVEAEGAVERYLSKEVWAPPLYEQNAAEALVSRVTDTVVLVHQEKNSVLKAACP